MDENQPIEQAGFRKNFSTIDHSHAIKQVLEKYNEYQIIYYSKAFEILNHKYIRSSLRGVKSIYIHLIKTIHSKSKSRIKPESKGVPFSINRGVRQGDPLSPKVFNVVLEQIFRKID